MTSDWTFAGTMKPELARNISAIIGLQRRRRRCSGQSRFAVAKNSEIDRPIFPHFSAAVIWAS
jgi:hypothetical protein